MALTIAGVVVLVLVFLNARATRAVLADDLSTQGQRAAQIAFVWLVPFLGALLTLHFKRIEPEASAGRYLDNPDIGDDPIASTPSYRMSTSAADFDSSSGQGGSGK